MIATLTGQVTDIGAAHIVLDVGGVGYLVYVTGSSGFTIGESATLFTHLAVRENALDLYGFKTRDERTMFEHLIKLPKIGPKTASQILAQVDLPTLRRAVASEDPSYLSKMSGIGKKSAEKIVSGLKDILGDEALADFPAHEPNVDTDVIEALLALGYSERDARDAAQRIPADIAGTNARIKHALREVKR
ncbi:MAG TPA: Holliday junction branch migration protein RuvA [Candidatus Paceibacterota bacterium]|nr:Holliday junction branch migration protein RuvA [Candidatus Paceibacterota bacterium]